MQRLLKSTVTLTVVGLVLSLIFPAPDLAIGSAVGPVFMLDLLLSMTARNVASSHAGARRAVLAGRWEHRPSDARPLMTDAAVTKDDGEVRRLRGCNAKELSTP